MRVEPSIAPLPVDTFEPACLLVPDVVMEAVGARPWTPSLGLRLRKMGFAIFMAPGYAGTSGAGPGGVAAPESI